MQKPTNRKELKAAKENFYNKMMQEPMLRVYTKKLAHLSTEDPLYEETIDAMYAFLDVQFQLEIGYGVENEILSATND